MFDSGIFLVACFKEELKINFFFGGEGGGGNLKIRGSACVSRLHSYANFFSIVSICCVISFSA